MSEFVKLVEQMREAQKSYFRHRNSLLLELSKDLERKVDKAIREHNDKQAKLFD